MEKFGKRPRSSNNEIARPFQKVRKREEVDMQCARAAVSAGLPMSFFDNPEVRKTVLMTAECGQNYMRTKPGGVKEPTLTHRTFFTTKVIPRLDKLIEDKNMGKMREMVRDLVAAVFRDGWTTVNHHPIVNIIMGVRSLHTRLPFTRWVSDQDILQTWKDQLVLGSSLASNTAKYMWMWSIVENEREQTTMKMQLLQSLRKTTAE